MVVPDLEQLMAICFGASVGCRVWSDESRVNSVGCRVWGVGCGVWGVGCRV